MVPLKIILSWLCTCSIVTAELIIPENLDWWQSAIIYQIYPRSFKDSNEDGIGDLKGIEQQLPYFADLGINVLWLSPIFKSPMVDMGYDVADFKEIDPIFGTMEDFDSLVSKMKSMGMKIILDFVPNHSSDQCEWFQKSIKKINPYTNYYVWKDPKNNNGTTPPLPPNNWISVFEGSAWEYNEERKQFYLHQFAKQQPDFNFRSSELVNELKNILKFWLDKGIDGFRVDSANFLYENITMVDEPVISNITINHLPAYRSLNHTFTLDQPENYQIISEFRKILDEYSEKDKITRLLLIEAYSKVDKVTRYYGNYTVPIAHIPFNFLLTSLNYTSNAHKFMDTINQWINATLSGNWPNWVLGNHDLKRVATRFSEQLVDGLNMLITLLPGTGITYQGEELGMTDTKIRWDQTTDVLALNAGPLLYTTVSRDPARTPFQWNSTLHAGFSHTNGNPWLPVNPNYYTVNVKSEQKDPRSHYNVYKSLLKLRQNKVIRHGDFQMYAITEWVFAFKRSMPGEEMFIIVINLNNQEEYINLNVSIPDVPETMNVFIPSSNSEYNVNDKLNTENTGFKMRPNSALVLQAVMKKVNPAHYYAAGNLPQISTLLLFICVIFMHFFK